MSLMVALIMNGMMNWIHNIFKLMRSNGGKALDVNSTLDQCKKLTDITGEQFIELHDNGTPGIPYSAKFRTDHTTWELHGLECSVTIGSSHLPLVSIDPIGDLNNASDFSMARDILLENLKTNEVLVHQVQAEITNLEISINTELLKVASEQIEHSTKAKCMLELLRLAEEHSYEADFDFCNELSSSELINRNRLEELLVSYAELKNVLRYGEKVDPTGTSDNDRIATNSFLREALKKAFELHKKDLAEVCSQQVRNQILNMEYLQCMLLGPVEINVLSDLEYIFSDANFETVVPAILKSFASNIANINLPDYCQFVPAVNGIYVNICKSLLEIAAHVEEVLGMKNVIQYTEKQWKMVENSVENHQTISSMDRCYITQLNMLINLSNHFEPGKPTSWKHYPYTIQIEFLDPSKTIPCEQHLWLCLIDFTILEILNGDLKREFSHILVTFRDCLQDQQNQSWDFIRRISHDTLEFVALTEQKSILKHAKIGEVVLQKQLNFVHWSLRNNINRFKEFSNYIHVLRDYWKSLSLQHLSKKLRGTYLSYRVEEIEQMFLYIANHALSKNVEHMKIVDFLGEWNKLAAYIEQFPFEWYVRFTNERVKLALLDANIVSVTRNRLQGTKCECFTVSRQHYELFTELFAVEDLPQQFQVEISTTLLEYTVNLLQKERWKSEGELLSDDDQLNVTMLMIYAIRGFLAHLKEQPKFLDFDRFYKEVIEKFSSMVKDCISLEDFANRAAETVNYFENLDWQQTIDIENHIISLTSSPLKQCKKLMNSDKDQYIELRNSDAAGLPYSAKLRLRNSYWKLHGAEGLITIGATYVAKATITSVEQLNGTSDFSTAQRLLLNNVKVERVLIWSFISENWLNLFDLANKEVAKQQANHRDLQKSYYADYTTIDRSEQKHLDPTTIEKIRSKMYGRTLKERGQLTDETEKQYIKLRNTNVGGVPYSAAFDYESSTWKLHGEECLITIGTSYVAHVSIESIAELNDEYDFSSAKAILLKHIRINNVLLDEHQEGTANALECLSSEIIRLGDESATNVGSARCLLELWRIGQNHKYKLNDSFAEDVFASNFVHCKKLKAAISKCVVNSSKLEKRNIFQRVFTIFQNTDRHLHQFLERSYIKHKESILKLCSTEIKKKLINLELQCFMLLREEDVKLFSDLECALNQTIIAIVLPQIVDNFVTEIRALKPADYCQSLPLVNLIYFHVCKGLVEMTDRVELELLVRNIVNYTNGQWLMTSVAHDTVETVPSKCLLKQLEMLVKFANHFEPGKASSKDRYPYDIQIRQLQRAKNLRDEHHLWLCLVDSTMTNILQENSERIQEYSVVMETLEKCLSSEEIMSHESIRVVTHNTLELVAHIEQSGYGLNEVNKIFLEKQLQSMSQAIFYDKPVFTQFRDTTEVFKDFWARFNDVLPKLSSKFASNYLRLQLNLVEFKLWDVILKILKKNLQSDDITRFFRTYNDFIMDLKELHFEWYVRFHDTALKNNLLEKDVISNVEDDLKNTYHKCYQVKSGMENRFEEICTTQGVPKHYQIEIICTFLDYIIDLTQKQNWKQTMKLTETDQLDATILLINAVRSSLMYLKEQPIYVNYENFYEETINPFISVIGDSDSMESFTKRIELVKKSFWYIRNQNSIGINTALQLCKQSNNNFNETILRTGFELYNDHFEKYLRDHRALETDSKIQNIVQDVRAKVTPMIFSEWTTEFKQTVIPNILAGLGAVWSIMMSIDVASSGSYLKPHPIQVLSVFRLLSMDEKTVGVEKHLAQILSGQGKSLTLGLVAALLALFGHDVEIVCYSNYLARRDRDDFRDFYVRFSISSQISYKTFDDMVRNQIGILGKRAKQYIRKCIGLSYTASGDIESIEISNKAVLLIDEVDVFFKDNFYGNSYNKGTSLNITGLGLVQQKIWELVRENQCNIEDSVRQYICSSDHPNIQQLRSLMNRDGSYTLLTKCSEVTESQYTNELLFQEQFKQMIIDAESIHKLSVYDDLFYDYKLDPVGRIMTKDHLGQFVVHRVNSYCNSFMYFKLRGNNFIENANGSKNFGYLILRCTSFSYSKIPEKYPLILGVTGTLTDLIPYEKNAVENHYNIKRNSIMPSFFGGSNLSFSHVANFQCLKDDINWRKMIFTRVNAIINAHRSLIVFFEGDVQIYQFKKDFEKQLDRLNEITINTESSFRDRYIAEAGLARTITLATREMGRGVDYKSSLLVEKNGGIHIIQTFFSLDVKEETQIKGRTARKDNRGSYELIVCRPHLEKLKLFDLNLNDDEISYNYLDASRKRITAETYSKRASAHDRANAKHEKCMQFCKNIKL